jgi:hypothetical protein
MKKFIFAGFVIIFDISYLNAADFTASYKWCNPSFRTTSPAVELKNAPKDTAKLEMTIVDLYNSKLHLNAKVDYQNQKSFECGSLAKYWDGLGYPPGHCGNGVPHTYAMTIKAIDKSGNMIAKSEYSRGCPE